MPNLPYTIHNGNSLEVLKTLDENSIDSIVCDPPYELGFMNKKWDSSGIAYNVELWKECLRVLKPGGHLLAFSGSRTYHRMAVAIEDAGFEIDRGAKGNSSFLWIESSEKWSANNGNTAFYVGAESDGVYANGAFAAANTASSTGTAAGSYANSAFSVANSATTSAATADAKAVSAGSYANSAFLLANGASFVANTDFTNLTITAADHGSASAVAAFRVEANGRISSANSTAIAIAASAITSGTLGVTRGGTGAGTFTSSGVLLGAGTSAFTTASSSTEGHVLTINASGVPTFSHLQGGTF